MSCLEIQKALYRRNSQTCWRMGKNLGSYSKQQKVLYYIRHKVNVKQFFVPFRGDFQGSFYDSATPPKMVFANNKPPCTGFEGTMQRLRNGSLSIWGRVGSVYPPHLVLPITVEPSKPRMCHDEPFFNLWIKELPLKLDDISDLPRYVGKFHFQTTLDDKSGYDHVALSEDSYTFFGLEWQGWYFVLCTIPFGWKGSAYLYHTIGLASTSYTRSFGVPCSQYIDDRHVGQLAVSNASLAVSPTWSDFELAEGAVFICAAVLVSLGFF